MSGLSHLDGVSEPVAASASLGESQSEPVMLILSGQRSIADFILLWDVEDLGLRCVGDAESHHSGHYWKALECCSRAECTSDPRGKL